MKKPPLEQKFDLLLEVLAKGFEAAHKHNEEFRDAIVALADTMHHFEQNMQTFYANVEQRFNAMHLEHDLIIDMLSRIHGIDDQTQDKKNRK